MLTALHNKHNIHACMHSTKRRWHAMVLKVAPGAGFAGGDQDANQLANLDLDSAHSPLAVLSAGGPMCMLPMIRGGHLTCCSECHSGRIRIVHQECAADGRPDWLCWRHVQSQ